MDAKLGYAADALSFLSALEEEPYRYDFYQTMRRLECLYGDKPRWGTALRPIDEPVRLGQEAELAFPPTSLASFQRGDGKTPPRLQVRLFGLLGPNGPLPIHLTEYARDRARHHGDPTLVRFLDVLQHRFIALFYRAWAQAQPHINRDRPSDDRFTVYVGATIGTAQPTLRNRDSVPNLARLFHAGTLIRHVRNADGLASIVRGFFEVPADVEQFVGHWMTLGPRERSYLGRDTAVLGRGAVLGGRVWDHQSKFRIHLGPLTLDQYEDFLPAARGTSSTAGGRLRQLVDWVRFYVCSEFEWDVKLRLNSGEVPSFALGGGGRLGWTTWLGTRRAGTDAGDLCLDAETLVERDRVA
ncbi:MAG: type VI secretion system baseplate subunit TssG [Vicinamibacterales bacterium]